MVRRFRLPLLAAACVVVLGAGQALAQSAYCDRLRADLAALGRQADSGRARAINEQITRQQRELDRLGAYARSIGCGRQRFLIFGDPPPPECGALEARMSRMEAAIAALDAQAERAGGAGLDAERASLQAAYETNCRFDQGGAGSRAAAHEPGLLERLFGGGSDVQAPPEESIMAPDETPSGPGGTFKTLCVRKCDGYYFPISPVATQSRVDGDTALCQASCPNAEVELFMQPAGREVDAAVAADGTPYTSLPNAFHYRKAVDSSCSCRAPGQSWAEALSQAEQLLGSRSNDIVVTEEKAQELAKPLETARGKPPKPAKGKQPAPAASDLASQSQAAAVGAAAPTAGTQSSGIGTGRAGPATLSTGQGETRQIVAPDGSRKTVRIVAPSLGPDIVPQ